MRIGGDLHHACSYTLLGLLDLHGGDIRNANLSADLPLTFLINMYV